MPDRLRVVVFLVFRSIKAMSGSPVRLSAQARMLPEMAAGLAAGAGGDGRLAARFDIIEVDIKISGALVHPGDAIPIDLGLDLLLLTGGDDLLLAAGQVMETDAIAAIAIVGPDHIIPAYVRLGLVALRRSDYGFGSVDGIIEVGRPRCSPCPARLCARLIPPD